MKPEDAKAGRRLRAAIIGPGNIGIDLMMKILKGGKLELVLMTGVDPESPGLRLAAERGIKTSTEGIQGVLQQGNIDIAFDATGAKAHASHAPLLRAAGIFAIDLTPAAVGPYCVPCVNTIDYAAVDNVNMVTCGGQATIPIVAAVNSVTPVRYAEIVATIASKSAGPGTRQNIDEFTETTAAALVKLGGAQKGKALIILNPAEPPLLMRNTIYCQCDTAKLADIVAAIEAMVARVKKYVPGYRLKVAPYADGDFVITAVEVEGAGDYLPTYSGNLDIITSAAVAIAEDYAARRTGGQR